MIAPTSREDQDQRVFRVLLQAMSHPGRVYRLPQNFEEGDPLMLILQCLADHEVSFHMTGDSAEGIADRLYAMTKARLAPLADADYVVATSPAAATAAIREAKRGTAESPDQGATVISLVPACKADAPSIVRLRGPGIHPDTEGTPIHSGPGENVWRAVAEANCEYPLGVDCVFVDGDAHVMCVPRSTRVTFPAAAATGGD